jgi:GAF domain-containing protein/HAMP domain-containing protein
MDVRQTYSSRKSQTAGRITQILMISPLAVVVGYLGIYLFLLPAWQMLAVSGLLVLFSGLCMFSIGLIKQEKVTAGMWLVIGGMYVVFPVFSALMAGLSVVLAVSLILLTALVSTQTLPARQSQWALLGSLVAALITVLVDTPQLDYRLSLPLAQTVLTVITVIVVVILTVLIVRQFADFPLQTKLVLTFLIVSLVSVGAVSFFTSLATTDVLTTEAGNNLQNLARFQSQSLGDTLAREVAVLRSLSLSPNVRERVRIANERYGNVPLVGLVSELQAADEEWRANPDSPVARARLTSPVARELQGLQTNFPNHKQLMVTDRYGALVGVTDLNTDFYQGDEPWWQTAYGRKQPVIGRPVFQEDTQSFAVDMTIPVFDDNGQTIGILRSVYDISDVLGPRTLSTDQAGIETDLLLFGDQAFSFDDNSMETYSADTVSNLASLGELPYSDIVFEGVPSLVSRITVAASNNNLAVQALDWQFIVRQELSTALAPVQQQTRNTMLLALLIATVVIGVAIGMTQLIASPILRLTTVARQFAGGNLATRASIDSADEVGALASTFNLMADRLGLTIDTLESRVAERTNQLETVVTVGRQLSAILDLNALMHEVVTLTKERFNYYHVHIYLFNEAKDTLVMAEGYGQAGIAMKRQGHSIPAAAVRSLVAQAGREGKTVIVANVRQDTGWLPNPLLPDTQSEMAVPVMLEKEVVGVLDVQSDKSDGLDSTDEVLLTTLAQQIAVAVRNARIFNKTRVALQQAERLQSLYTGSAWERFTATRTTQHYEIREESLPALTEIDTPEALSALQQGQTVRLHIGNGSSELPAADSANSLATPLRLRNQTIGVLGIRDERDANRHWTDDEIALVEAVSEQMSQAIENARLFEETGRRAGREKMIAEMTRQVWASGELEGVMRTAIQELGHSLNASKVVIQLGTIDDLQERSSQTT